MIRLAKPSDLESIVDLVDLAFAPSRFESGLIMALVNQSRLIHHWVTDGKEGLDAYVCYSRAYRSTRDIGFHLAPVAVRPNVQRAGLGSSLIRATLLEPPLADQSVFVLGDPLYYARFGFKKVMNPVCSFDTNNDHFMALRYEDEEGFIIGYEPEFATI